MTTQNWFSLLQTLLPILILLLGGQRLIDRYSIAKKFREEEIALARAIREQQYQAVSALYTFFGQLMELYREINYSPTYPNDETERLMFLKRASEVEASVDALILRISCEFVTGTDEDLEQLLGHMRQSVQTWREVIKQKKRLPFTYSHQKDYERFKETFAGVAAFMVHRIHYGLTPPKMRMDEAKSLLANVFSNKYEHLEYAPVQGKDQWVRDVKARKHKNTTVEDL